MSFEMYICFRKIELFSRYRNVIYWKTKSIKTFNRIFRCFNKFCKNLRSFERIGQVIRLQNDFFSFLKNPIHLKWFVYSFWCDFISLKKDKISSMLIFSNRSFMLFVMKYRLFNKSKISLYEKVFNSVGCLTCCSCYLRMKICISLVWTMHNQDIVAFSFPDFPKAGFHSPKVGFIK